MNIQKLRCCAVSEISSLSSYRYALHAMRSFCKDHQMNTGKLRHPGSFIMFTGVIEIAEGSSDYLISQGLTNVSYGPKFAAYILKHGLGTVTEVPPQRNQNHKTHLVKIWVWNPDLPALQAWWDKNKPKTAAKVVRF